MSWYFRTLDFLPRDPQGDAAPRALPAQRHPAAAAIFGAFAVPLRQHRQATKRNAPDLARALSFELEGSRNPHQIPFRPSLGSAA